MWSLKSKYTIAQCFPGFVGQTVWKRSHIYHNSEDREKMLCFIKIQQGSHIFSHAWIMYDPQCYLLDCLITNIFQNVYISFSSLRTNMNLYRNITYLWTLRIIFFQISMHTSTWHEWEHFSAFLEIKILGKGIPKNHSNFLHPGLISIFKLKSHFQSRQHTWQIDR